MNNDIPTAFILRRYGFQEVSRLDYRPPAWFDKPDERIGWNSVAMSDETRSILPLVAELLQRIVPGIPVNIVPSIRIHASDTATSGSLWGGLAFYEPHGVALSGSSGAWNLIDTTLHEVWHVAEDMMSVPDRALCRASIRDGLPLPSGYYDSTNERSSRSFTAWALHQLSRSSTPSAIPTGPRTAEQIYAQVFAGCYVPWYGSATYIFENKLGFLARTLCKFVGDEDGTTIRRVA